LQLPASEIRCSGLGDQFPNERFLKQKKLIALYAATGGGEAEGDRFSGYFRLIK
jgi:hypothetical protein